MTRTSPSLFAAVVLTLLFGSSLLSAQAWKRDRIKPTAPTNLTVIATTEHSVTLQWGPSTDNSGSFTYSICCKDGKSITVSQHVTTHTIEGLQSGKTYIFRVYARDAAGNLSNSSNPVTVTLPGEIAAPTKPFVQVQDVGPTHVSLSWSSTDNGPIIMYIIYIDGGPVGWTHLRSGTFTCASTMVPTYCDPINQDTSYTFTVQARDSDNNLSPMSDPVFVTTDPVDPNDHTPPTQPANVTANVDGAFINVAWNASTDAVAPQSLIRYDVYVNGDLRAVVVGALTAQVESDFLQDNVITVIAVDTADNESVPGTITVAG